MVVRPYAQTAGRQTELEKNLNRLCGRSEDIKFNESVDGAEPGLRARRYTLRESSCKMRIKLHIPHGGE